MRGNELSTPEYPDINVWLFLIPMRGNEPLQHTNRDQTAERFLIPMRGNETLFRTTQQLEQYIPNPHEG